MFEVGMNSKGERIDRQQFFSELLYIAKSKDYNPHWASHKYRERFGVWPNGIDKNKALIPSTDTLNWVKHKTIAYVKAMQKQGKQA
jgi:hypothetical protein